MRVAANRLVAVVLGAFFVIAGVTGLIVTAGESFFSMPGRLLLGIFAINPFRSSVDILIGAALAIAGLSAVPAAKIVNTIAGLVLLALAIGGLFVIGSGINLVALNGADNVLHAASAVILLAVGLGADRAVTTAVTS